MADKVDKTEEEEEEKEEETSNGCDTGNSCEDIDLNALAQKIYALLKQDLKIQQERLGCNKFNT